jgi:DNA-directed RNA polymerase beta' subunit
VRNGPDVYPGAKCLRQGNRTFLLKNKDRTTIELKEGDVVERHMINGDYVLFNRQPSLHRMSMMGHRVVVMPFNTFRSNPSVCPCFNSDYDGDEMNIHMPQSIVTMNELVELAAVPTQIISPRECKPIIAIVQDVPLGVYRLTKSHVFLNQKMLFNLMSLNPRFAGYIPPPMKAENGVARWSGRQMLSTIIPKNINVRAPNKSYNGASDKENFVVIENGEIKQGIVDKLIYQNRTKGLIHSIFNECGPDETRMFFDNTQRICCDWLVNSGFSVGISDLIVNTDTNENLKKVIHEMKVKVYKMIADVHTGKFENRSISNNNDFFEEEVNKILNRASSEAGQHGLSTINDLTNRMMNMIKSQSKGNIINVAQMIACLGQVNVEGKRIPYGFQNRTLPHYTQYDDGPESRGFIQSSFVKGLNPQEFFFHSEGGREGLIDTAVKTSETGYLQRKLVKAMEDCKVNYDHTVRNASGTIVQFLYGEDGMDPTKIESQQIPYIEMDFATLHKTYNLTAAEDLTAYLDSATLTAFKKSSGWEERLNAHFEQVLQDREYMISKIFNNRLESNVMYPVSFQRIITNTRAMFKNPGATNLNPLYVLDELEKLCDQVYVSKVNKGNMFFQVLARAYLSPKRVLMEYKFDKNTFDYLLQMIRMRFYDSIAHPSEMVGVISAQSIGEPCTQLSITEESRVHILFGSNEIYVGPIGKFVDDVLAASPDKVIDLGNNSVVMNLDETNKFSIIGVSNDEKTSWKPISQVSRHPANGGMVRVHTRSGKDTCATLSHSFLKRTESSIVPVLGSELKEGDRIPVAKYIPVIENPKTTIMIGEKEYQLTKDLGWFFGAYLADGSCNGSSVIITKVDESFQEKLRQVFNDVFGAKMFQRKKVHKKPVMLNGYDMSKYEGMDNYIIYTDLARFLSDWGICYTKRIPAWVFSSNLEFIKGVIGGYFDGDGNVNQIKGKQMIRSASVSEGMTEDFILLLTYVGIFASKCLEVRKEENRDNLHSVQISRKYARVFKEQIGLVITAKAKALDDVIDYVEKEDVHDEKEIIDMIPELGNALAFVGKALEITGQSRRFKRYINKAAIGRRTLIKYIQEFKNEYTTRTNDLQTKYQENLAKIEVLKHHLSTTPVYVRGTIDLPEEVGVLIAQLGSDLMPSKGCAQWATLRRTTQKTLQKHIDNFSSLIGPKRDTLKAQYDSILPYMDILMQAANSDVVWDEIVKLEYLPDPGTFVYDFTVPGNDSFMVDCGVLVHNTLNSVEWNTEVLMDMDGTLERVKIGEFIDNQLEALDEKSIENHSNDTKLGWIKEKEYKILSVDEEGKIDWKLVEAVTKHPPINEDGSHTLVKVVTKSGREVTATKAKSFLKREDNKIVPVRGEDLKVGDFVPVSTVLPVEYCECIDKWDIVSDFTDHLELSHDFGYLLGVYLAKGYSTEDYVVIPDTSQSIIDFCKKYDLPCNITDTVDITSPGLAQLFMTTIGNRHNKRIPAELLGAKDEFLESVFEGLNTSSSTNRGLLEDIQQLLSRLEIMSTIEPDVDGYKMLVGRQLPDDIIPHVITKEHGEISIPRAQLGVYLKNAKVEDDKAVYQQLLEENVFYDEIVSIEEVESEYPYVYDLTIKDTRNFNIYNGLCMRDTFHLSGVSSASKAVRGVPRIKELLSVTKNIKAPAVTVYLDETIRRSKNESKKVLNSIQTTFFKDIVKSSKIYFDPDDFNTTIEDDRMFLATYKEFIKADLMEESTLTPWLLRMEFDKEKMKEYEITMMDVNNVIYDFYRETVNCMFSDDSSNNIVMRIKLPDSSNHEDIITELKALEKNIMENIIINGVRKINKVVMNNKEYKIYNEETRTFEPTNEWILETNGTNLLEVLGHKYVDPTRTISNDVNEIYEILGVEATRQALYNEISDIIADGDLYVNYRHISLLVDTMTNKGYLLSIDRHGINRVDIGPLAKCSFEEVTDMLVKAGIFAEVDKISGVSANIMLGQIPPYGTGDTEILIDENKLLDLATIAEEDDEPEEDGDPYLTAMDPVMIEDVCDIENIGFNFNIPSIDETIKPITIPITLK